MKKSRILIISISIFALLFVSAYAYMIKQTPYVKNQLEPANVSCQVVEKTESGSAVTSQKNSIKVENTSDITAYVRVRLVTYWMDGSTIATKASEKLNLAVTDNWIAGEDNTYYCKTPVASNESTPELLSAPVFLEYDDETGYVQVIEIVADAIQYKPYDAIEDNWNVTINDDGIITSVNK